MSRLTLMMLVVSVTVIGTSVGWTAVYEPDIHEVVRQVGYDDETREKISISPDSHFFAVTRRTGIDIYDIEHPDLPIRRLATDDAPIINTVFDPAWRWAAISRHEMVSLIDLETGEPIYILEQRDNLYPIHFIALDMMLSPDAQWLATVQGQDQGIVTVWNTMTGEERFQQIHRYSLSNPLFSEDGHTFVYRYGEPCYVSCNTPISYFWFAIDTTEWDFFSAPSEGRMFGQFHLPDGEPDSTQRGPFVTSVQTVHPQPNGFLLVSTDWWNTSEVWDSQAGALLYALPPHREFYGFSPDGDLLMLLDQNAQTLQLIDPLTQVTVNELTLSHGLKAASISPDGNTLVLLNSTDAVELSSLRE